MSTNVTNVPSNYFMFKVNRYAASDIVQYGISLSNKAFYYRFKDGSGWKDWQQLYDTSLLTNSSLLSPLASALGALNLYNEVTPQHFIQSSGDVLNINCGGLWQLPGKDENNVYPAHHPDPEHWYYAYAYGTAGVTIIIAVATRNEKAFIGVRRDNDITWKQIQYTT